MSDRPVKIVWSVRYGYHISHILTKLHLAYRTQRALYDVQAGLARPDAG